MKDYWEALVNDIPHELYLMALIVLLAFLLLFVWWRGLGKGLRYSLGVLLVEYLVLIYCSTVFFRPTGKVATYDYKPFWSYQAYFEGREPNALIENFANVLVFVPIGMMLACMINGLWLKNRTGWLIALFIGLGFSIGIEVLQFVLKKGFSEIDDIMHNTLGCAVGYGIYCWIRKLFVRNDSKILV